MKGAGRTFAQVLLLLLLVPGLSLGALVKIPKTGQTKCYDDSGVPIDCAGTGQDGEFQAGVAWPSPRFVDNGDGTLTDRLTGLMWLKDASCLSAGGWKNWQEALDAVRDFNDDPSGFGCKDYTAGYSDWRLPNVKELRSLINYSEWQACMYLWNQGFYYYAFAPCSIAWSSTTYAGDTTYAWTVDFSKTNGEVAAAPKNNGMSVIMAVRAGPNGDPDSNYPANLLKTGQTTSYDNNTPARDDGALQRGISWPSPRFEKGCIIDNATGLVYINVSKCIKEHYPSSDTDGTPGDGKVTFNTALELIEKYKAWHFLHCEPIPDDCDKDTCRMTNVNELEKVFDYSRSDTVFSLAEEDEWPTDTFYWTSTGLNYSPKQIVINPDGGETLEGRTELGYVAMVCDRESAPRISVEPNPVDFGNVVVPFNKSLGITVKNIGNKGLNIGQIMGADTGGQFSKYIDDCSNSTLSPKQSCLIAVSFAPRRLGLQRDILRIPSNDPDSPELEVELRGTGIPPTGAESNGNNGETNDPVSTATGEIYFHTVDLYLGGPLPLYFSRYYASYLDLNGKVGTWNGPLGANWMHNFELRLEKTDTEATVIYYKGKTIEFVEENGAWKLKNKEPVIYQLLASGTDHKLMDPSRDLIFTFDDSGRLTKIEDRNGNAHTLTYSGGRLTRVSDGLGRSLSFAYDANGHLIEVQDQTGRKIAFGHGGTGNYYLTSYTDPRGNVTSYSYTQKTGVMGLLVSLTRPEGNTPYTQTFDDMGRVTTQSDSRGETTQMAYDTPEAGKTQVTDPLGNTFTHSHEVYRSLTNQMDQTGNVVQIGYDDNDRRNSVTDRLGDTTTFTYHAASGKLASYTNALGHTIVYTYQAQTQDGFTFYNLTKIDYPDGTHVDMTYDSHGNMLTLTDQAGKKWTYSYNSRGQILSVTNPSGGRIQCAYNDDGTLASMTDPFGHTTTFSYDAQKRLTRITHPDGTFRSFAYDENDNLLSVTDERGNTANYAYDKNNNLKSVQDPLGNTTSFGYDGNDRLVSVTDRGGKTYTYAYNQAGDLAQVTNPSGESTTFGYDAHRWVTSITDPDGKTTQMSYDKEGVISSITDPLSNTWSYATNALGKIASVATPLGHTSSYSYDSMGRLSSFTTPLSHTIAYSYDSRGLLSELSLPEGISAAYARDDLGLVAQVTDPRGNHWKFNYDEGGRLVSRSDPLGRSFTYEYDSRNRVSKVTMPDGGTMEITRDEAGNIVRRKYSDGTDLTYDYDALNRLTSASGLNLGYDERGYITNSNGIAVTRDDLGRIRTVTFAGGKTITYTYNTQSLVSKIEDWLGGETHLSYDDAGRLISIERPNGITTELTYDNDGRLIGLKEKKGVQSLSEINLLRDGEGKITQAERDIPLFPVLNRGTRTLSYNSANEVESYTYDQLGRLTQDNQRIYTWDLAGRLKSFNEDGTQVNYEYDALGQMIKRIVGTLEKVYVWNYAFPLPSISIVRENGQDKRYYVHLPSGFLLYSVEASDNSRRFYHFDEMGTTLFLTDDAGTITDTYGVTPYGLITASNGATENPFVFGGAYGVMLERSPGLYYMRARFYDGETGRFLTVDPLSSSFSHIINPYHYAGNDPINIGDPLGTSPQAITSQSWFHEYPNWKEITDVMRKRSAKESREANRKFVEAYYKAKNSGMGEVEARRRGWMAWFGSEWAGLSRRVKQRLHQWIIEQVEGSNSLASSYWQGFKEGASHGLYRLSWGLFGELDPALSNTWTDYAAVGTSCVATGAVVAIAGLLVAPYAVAALPYIGQAADYVAFNIMAPIIASPLIIYYNVYVPMTVKVFSDPVRVQRAIYVSKVISDFLVPGYPETVPGLINSSIDEIQRIRNQKSDK